MKCPKCNYVSFDYNQICPKCSKDISAEQDKLHLPAFRPNPPAALSALLGDANESHAGIHMSDSSEVRISQEADLSLDDSSAMDSGEVAFDDSQDVGVSMAAGGVGFGGETGEYEAGSQGTTSDFEFESPVDEDISFEPIESPVDDISLEPAESPVDLDLGGEEEAAAPSEEKEGLIDSSEINLDELSLDESEKPGATEGKRATGEADFDLGGLDLGAEGAELSEGEIELNLDDLKVNGSGELKIGAETAPPEEGDKAIESGEISLDEIPLGEEGLKESEGLTLDLEKEPKKEGAASDDDDVSIDLEDLDLDLDLEDNKVD